MEPYFFRLFRQAFTTTAKDFGFEEVRRLIIKFGLFLASIVVLGIFGWSDIFIDTLGAVWAGVVALLAIFPFVFFWNLLITPAQLQKEADDEIARLNLVIENKEEIQKALDELWELRRAGVQLRNRRITIQQLPDWVAEFEEWNPKVLDASGRVSPNLRNWLEVLDDTRGRPINVPIVSGDHELKVRVMTEILRRLQTYLVRSFF